MEKIKRTLPWLKRRIQLLDLPDQWQSRLRAYGEKQWRGMEILLPLDAGRPPQLRLAVGRPQKWENGAGELQEQFTLPLAVKPPPLAELLESPALASAGERILANLSLGWHTLVQPDRDGVLTIITERVSPARLGALFRLLSLPSDALPGFPGSVRLELPVDDRGLRNPVGIRIRSGQVLREIKDHCDGGMRNKLVGWQTARPGVNASTRLDEYILFYSGQGLVGVSACPAAAARTNPAADAYDHPIGMNLELTTRCPLRCPQCYCDLNSGQDMPLEVALHWLREGAENGVEWVGLSGGETMCYPHLYEVIGEASRLGLQADVALSGYGFDQTAFDNMLAAGIGDIYISLNGSTEEINRRSRDGFGLAIAALELLKKNCFPRAAINWVVHDSNADSFADMIALAERYGVKTLVVMAFKPDSRRQLPSLPTARQMLRVCEQIKTYNGPLELQVEGCFSPMKALLARKNWISCDNRITRGCSAGRNSFAVCVDGRLAPCRHLMFPEEADSLRGYWEHSTVLETLRQVDQSSRPPCAQCQLLPQCRHCMDINAKLHGELFQGDSVCPLSQAVEQL